MTEEQALDINARLVTAWFIHTKIHDGPFPNLEGVTLTDAIQATELVSEMPGIPQANGSKMFRARVDFSVLPHVLGMTVAVNALERITREHQEKRNA